MCAVYKAEIEQLEQRLEAAEAIGRAAVRALAIQQDYRRMPLREWCEKYQVSGLTEIQQLRDGVADAALATDTAQSWLESEGTDD